MRPGVLIGAGLAAVGTFFLFRRAKAAVPPEELPEEEFPPEEELPEEEIPPEEELPPVPPEEPEIEVSGASAKKVVFTDAPAWETMVYQCTIKNVGNVPTTAMLNLVWTYGRTGEVHTFRSVEDSLAIPLQPGESYRYVWDGNTLSDRGAFKGPLIGGGTTHCMWMEDTYGTASAKACVTKPYG